MKNVQATESVAGVAPGFDHHCRRRSLDAGSRASAARAARINDVFRMTFTNFPARPYSICETFTAVSAFACSSSIGSRSSPAPSAKPRESSSENTNWRRAFLTFAWMPVRVASASVAQNPW